MSGPSGSTASSSRTSGVKSPRRLLKYDLGGNPVWERNYDFGVTSEYGTRLTLDSQGNVLVTGI